MEDATRQKKERAVWDRLASGYDGRVLKTYKSAYELSVEKASSVLSPDQEVLEIGCGTGLVAFGIAPCVRRVVATDISPEMISEAKRKAESASVPNVEFGICDGYSVPYEDGSFDAVLLFNTLHVVKEPGTVLREAYRLLRPSGHLISATDCYAEPVPFADRLMLSAQKLLKLVGVVSFVSYYRRDDLHRLFEQGGFIVEDSDVLHAVPVNYYLLGRKDAASDVTAE